MAFDAVSFWSDEVKGGGSGKGRREKEGRKEGRGEGGRKEGDHFVRHIELDKANEIKGK